MASSKVSAAQRTLLLDALVDPKPFHGQGVWTFPKHQLLLFTAKEPQYVLVPQLFRGGSDQYLQLYRLEQERRVS